jgi:G3E family GTPase
VDEVLDRVGDLEVQVATVKSEKGRVEMGLCFGIDGALARGLSEDEGGEHAHEHEDGHEHKQSHQSEVEVLSITLKTTLPDATINTTSLTKLLETAPKDEVYRIKSVFAASEPIPAPDSESEKAVSGRYILNWAFGRWTCTLLKGEEHVSSKGERVVLRMTMILARFESKKWKKKIETLGFVGLEGGMEGELRVEKIG